MAKIEYLNETEVKELIKQTIKDIESGVRNKELQQAIGGGLYLIVELNRESYYRVRPTVKKKRTWVTIGAVRLKNKANIPGLTLSDARDKVLEYKKAFTDGNNLIQARKQNIECSTVHDLCNEYKKVVPIIRNSKASELSILYSINTIQNILGETKLIDLTEDDIEYNILRPKAEHIPAMRKDFKTLRQMLNYAIDKKYINNNPANTIASPLLKFKHKPKRPVLNESDLEKLFNKLYELDNIPFKFAIAIHLLFLLMIRRVELVSVKWNQIDLTQAT
ncbi:MAG TPA: integrase arm-type DNA-binding domain-containing protein, partial [Aquella sp.]|nr:integrase arm-type DNA-binding domain-containing protein [Aquella sp.]